MEASQNNIFLLLHNANLQILVSSDGVKGVRRLIHSQIFSDFLNSYSLKRYW